MTKYFTVPNFFTALRALLIPILWYFAFLETPVWFGYTLLIYASTDFFDGFFARLLKQSTEFGAYFDGVVDDIGNFAIIPPIYFLFPNIIKEYWLLVFLIFTTYLFVEILKATKFKKVILHLYTQKITQTMFMLTILSLCYFNKVTVIVWIWVFFFFISHIEVVLTLMLKKPNSSTKTFFELNKKFE